MAIKFSNSVFFCALKEIAAESVKAPAILHIKTDRKLSEIASLLPTLQEPQMRARTHSKRVHFESCPREIFFEERHKYYP